MKKIIALMLAILMVLALCACGASEEGQASTDTLQAGFGRERIMPDNITAANLSGGDDPNRRCEGFLDYLFVTCVAIRDAAGETVLIYTMDTILSTNSLFNPMRTMIASSTGVSEDNIMLCATHTHSGVSIRSSWDGVDLYKQQFSQALVAAGTTAIADLSAADIYIGSTHADDLVFVRHYLLTDGTVTSSGVGAGSIMIAGHPAEKDSEVQIIRFERKEETKKDILMVSFNSHPTFNEGGLMLSADFPGPTRDFIESQGDYLVAYFTGDAGNQEEYSKINEENHGLDYKGFGQKLGQYVLDTLPNMTQIEAGEVKVLRQQYMGTANKERLDMLTKAKEVIALKQSQGIPAANELAKQYGLYQYLEAGAIINRANAPDKLPLDFRVIAVGEQLSFVFAPYEMFSESGSYIRANTPYDMSFLSSCSNGGEGYIPSSAAIEYGCYEGYVTKFAPGSAEIFADEFLSMLSQLRGEAQ